MGLVSDASFKVAFCSLPVPLNARADIFFVGPCACTSSVRTPSPLIFSAAETPAAFAIFSSSATLAFGVRRVALITLLGDVYWLSAKLTFTVVEPVVALKSLDLIVSGVSARSIAEIFTGCGMLPIHRRLICCAFGSDVRIHRAFYIHTLTESHSKSRSQPRGFSNRRIRRGQL